MNTQVSNYNDSTTESNKERLKECGLAALEKKRGLR